MNRIAVGQINPVIGDFEHNVDRVVEYARRAADHDAELIGFPELSICGYPPQDLLERPSFIEDNQQALHQVADSVSGIDVLVGFAQPSRHATGKPVHNAAALLRDGEVLKTHRKMLLPTYDVFDEARYFEPGREVTWVDSGDRIGLTVCEDIWNDPEFAASYAQPLYERNPMDEIARHRPDIVFNLSASPFVQGKDRFRAEMVSYLARKYKIHMVTCNMVGGNDALIFDGNSMVFNPEGDLIDRGAAFEEDLMIVDLDQPARDPGFEPEVETVYRGLTLGLSDYFKKCGFTSSVIGLSGGIDSSMTATLAVDALGPGNVLGVMMPSRISSETSVTDAEKLAGNLGIETRTFPIQEVFDQYLGLFEDEFAGLEWDATEENLQARIRGNILMALSNKYGHIVLNTGNKSELAVGYCTLYGDMAGGIGILSDVPKTMVYELARYVNEQNHRPLIPQNVLEKPPSAELSPDQTDQDDLPPYGILDQIIERYVEHHQSRSTIKEAGFDPDLVDDIVRRIDANEYKRQQAPLGLKVTSRSLGMGRVMPIAHRYPH